MIDVHHLDTISMDCSMTEFVGTTVLDTIGLVIPGTSPALLARMDLKKPYRSLGLLSSRTGAAGQIKICRRTLHQRSRTSGIYLFRQCEPGASHGI